MTCAHLCVTERREPATLDGSSGGSPAASKLIRRRLRQRVLTHPPLISRQHALTILISIHLIGSDSSHISRALRQLPTLLFDVYSFEHARIIAVLLHFVRAVCYRHVDLAA